MSHRPRLRPLGSAPLCLSFAAFLPLAGCASPGPELEDAEPYVVAEPAKPDSIGFHLAKLDNAISGWNRAKLEAITEEDQREVRTLERAIQRMARLRFGELVAELEAGPPANRSVAAVALGFTSMEEAQSPLLAALDDRAQNVVSNALLGLGLLGMPDTPLAQLCYVLSTHPDRYTRNNAAFALQRIVQAGGSDPCVVESARDALLDEEGSVRAKAALLLYLTEDTDSMTALGDLLYDDELVVTAAASTALAGLGREEGQTGKAARMLVAALDRVHPRRRARILLDLVRLRGEHLGDETEPWREWAYRLP